MEAFGRHGPRRKGLGGLARAKGEAQPWVDKTPSALAGRKQVFYLK